MKNPKRPWLKKRFKQHVVIYVSESDNNQWAISWRAISDMSNITVVKHIPPSTVLSIVTTNEITQYNGKKKSRILLAVGPGTPACRHNNHHISEYNVNRLFSYGLSIILNDFNELARRRKIWGYKSTQTKKLANSQAFSLIENILIQKNSQWMRASLYNIIIISYGGTNGIRTHVPRFCRPGRSTTPA